MAQICAAEVVAWPLEKSLRIFSNLLRSLVVGDDGLTPRERDVLAAEFEDTYLAPLNRPRAEVDRLLGRVPGDVQPARSGRPAARTRTARRTPQAV
jgi:hypothetical protein